MSEGPPTVAGRRHRARLAAAVLRIGTVALVGLIAACGTVADGAAPMASEPAGTMALSCAWGFSRRLAEYR
jgi:hypothetical protein